MASTFTLTASSTFEGRKMVLTCTQTKDIATNTSTIKWTLTTSGGLVNYYYTGPTTLIINGVRVYYKDRTSTSEFPCTKGSVSGTVSVPHAADGTKTIAVSLSTAIYYGEVKTNSGNWTLDTIPRAATITSAPNFNDEDNPVIGYANLAGSAVTKLEACICSSDGATLWAPYREIPINSTSYTFQLTNAERMTLQNATPDNSTLRVKFVIRTTLAGAYYYDEEYRNLTIVNADPIISATIVDTNERTLQLTGDENTLVRYRSDAVVTLTTAALKGATITSTTVSCGDVTLTDSGMIEGVTSGTFTLTVTDSRKKTTTVTIEKNLVDYVALTCSLENSRPDGTGRITLQATGVFFNGSYGAIDNALTVLCQHKVSGGNFGDWQEMTVTPNGNSYTATIDITGLDYQAAYVFRCLAVDKLDTVPTDEMPVKAVPVFDWGEEDFNFNVPVRAPSLTLDKTLTVRESLTIGECQVMDFVVDQGTLDDWVYRKWNSGLYECWGCVKGTAAVTTPWGALYISTSGIRGTFPFAFTDCPTVQATPAYDGSGDFWIATDSGETSMTQTAAYQLVRPTSYASNTYKINFYAIGHWK